MSCFELALYWDCRVDASNISAEVPGGKVELTGNVQSYSVRNAAVTAAWGVDGGREVDNMITVRFPPTFITPTEAEIETGAKRTLAWKPDVYGSDLEGRPGGSGDHCAHAPSHCRTPDSIGAVRAEER